jgi:hypothetical protein
MSLLFFDALQDPLLIRKPEWAATSWASAQTGRDGQSNGCARTNGGSSVGSLTLPSAAATVVLGFAMQVSTLSAAWAIGIHVANGTPGAFLLVNTSGMLEVRKQFTNGTLLGTSTGHTPIAVNTWHHYAIKILLTTLTTSTVTVQLDGVTVLTITGVATSVTSGSVNFIQFNGNASSNQDIDDVYVCDIVDATATQGRTNNDFLGDVRCAVLLPTSAGDTTGFTPSTGSNFAAVDEVPPNTTDYVSATTSATRDLYNLTDLSGTPAAIYAVRGCLYAEKTDSGIASLKPVMKENATVTVESAQGLVVGTYGAITSTMRAVKPSDSTVWSASDINALQVGQEVA